MSYYALDGDDPSQHKMCENLQSGATCLNCHAGGILPGTLVETDRGSIEISRVKTGDFLLTFENGMQPVVDITASNVWTSDGVCIKYFWPFYVPEKVLGNTKPILIMPEKQVLFKNDILRRKTGTPYALVPITALEGYRGIQKIVPKKRILSYKVKFAKNELLVLNGGSILSCKIEVDFLAEIVNPSPSFPYLDVEETKALLEKIENNIKASVKLVVFNQRVRA